MGNRVVQRPILRALVQTGWVLSLLAGPAFATSADLGAGESDDHRTRFPLDLKEMESRAAERFARADTNGDGSVSQAEFEAAAPPGRHRDAVGDEGQEFEPGAGRRGGQFPAGPIATQEAAVFAALDNNGNGQIERDEFSLRKVHEAVRIERQKAVFTRLDKNGDGMLSQEEMLAPGARLRALDTDQDGTVTRAEARAYRRANRY